MPRIIVVSDVAGGEAHVLLSERIDEAHLASQHSRDQLAERIRWAVADAQHVEHAHGIGSGSNRFASTMRGAATPIS